MELDLAKIQKQLLTKTGGEGGLPLNTFDYWFHSCPGGRDSVVDFLCKNLVISGDTDACIEDRLYGAKTGVSPSPETWDFWNRQPDNVLFRAVSCTWPLSAASSCEISRAPEEIDDMFNEFEGTDFEYITILVIRIDDRWVIDRRFEGSDRQQQLTRCQFGLYLPNLGGLEKLSIDTSLARNQLQKKVQTRVKLVMEMLREDGTRCLGRIMNNL